MFELITGGSGSGKSSYAEDRICELSRACQSASLYYIATMFPFGNGTEEKIADHRLRRKGKGFETIECYTGLSEKARMLWPIEKWEKLDRQDSSQGPCVLLECISNLAANELYMEEGACEQAVEAIVSGVLYLKEICSHLVVVTNEVFSDSRFYDEEMRHYQKVMGEINRKLASAADKVTEVVYGSLLALKEDKMKTTEKNGIKLVIGGAFQGKREYAAKRYPKITRWADGETCSFEEITSCEGIDHFHLFLRRWLKCGKEKEELLEQIKGRESALVIICDEIGYGLVPVDAFERKYRECVGRTMTALTSMSVCVERVICGIGQTIKEAD